MPNQKLPSPPKHNPYTGPPVSTSKKSKTVNPAISVAIPIRQRWGPRLENCMNAIQLQNQRNVEVVIADFGSTRSGHRSLVECLQPYDCTVYYCPTTEIWNLSRARNMGIRRASGRYVATLDVDMIMEPSVLSSILSLHRKHPRSLVISRVRNLPKTNLRNIRLPRDYPRLDRQAARHRPGVGGLMSASRRWWHRVRGFDERMKAWGADDDSLRKRARSDGLREVFLDKQGLKNVNVYHQHHRKAIPMHKKQLGVLRFNKLYEDNLAILRKDSPVIVNDRTWGCTP